MDTTTLVTVLAGAVLLTLLGHVGWSMFKDTKPRDPWPMNVPPPPAATTTPPAGRRHPNKPMIPPTCLSVWRGHVCQRPQHHPGDHQCGAPPCAATWTRRQTIGNLRALRK